MSLIAAYVGGARSGKSRLALERARAFGDDVAFVATLEPRDEEMSARVEAHRRARPSSWRTVEAPRELAQAVRGAAGVRCLVVDCLTLWLSNLLCDGADADTVLAEFDLVIAAARGPEEEQTRRKEERREVIFVSNEVGCGIVPEPPLARTFRDIAGLVNQRLVDAADEAYWVVCGRALRIE